MQIIIVGCGKVGRTLAEQLQEEESDITLIDVSSNVINSLQDDIDALGIVGNGASINTLMEAGIENADILIAVTGSDEMNLLCCLIAQKACSCTGNLPSSEIPVRDQNRYLCQRPCGNAEI